MSLDGRDFRVSYDVLQVGDCVFMRGRATNGAQVVAQQQTIEIHEAGK